MDTYQEKDLFPIKPKSNWVTYYIRTLLVVSLIPVCVFILHLILWEVFRVDTLNEFVIDSIFSIPVFVLFWALGFFFQVFWGNPIQTNWKKIVTYLGGLVVIAIFVWIAVFLVNIMIHGVYIG